MIFSKRNIMYALILWVVASVYYQEYKKNQALAATSVLEQVALRPLNGMDPIRLDDLCSIKAVSNVYEGLYAYHYLKRPLEIVPNLAEEMPVVSEDGLEYRIKIRKNVYFQDDPCFPKGQGRELKASDFVYSLKRTADPRNAVPYADFVKPYVKGLGAWGGMPVPDYAQNVEGLQAVDDYTLRITLTEPVPQFLYALAMPVCFVVPHEAVSHYGKAFLNHPVGTGPFVLQGGFNPQAQKLEFVRNPKFRTKLFPTEAASEYASLLVHAGKKLPLVDKVVTHVLVEEQPRFLKFLQGAIDVLPTDEAAFAMEIAKEGKLTDARLIEKGARLEKAEGGTTEFFGFNHTHPLLGGNLLLRKAMALAFDRETYNRLFYNNEATPAHALVPPSLLGEVASIQRHPCAFNLEQAKACLAQAGYPGGVGLPEFTLDVRSETHYKRKADFFAKCMAQIGVRVQVIANTWPELVQKIHVKKSVELFALRWCADYPEADSFLQLISDKSLIGLQYEHPEFNALLAQAKANPNKETRQVLYRKLNQMVADQLPMICTVHVAFQFLNQKWVRQVPCSGFDLATDQYAAIDLLEKKKGLA